MLHPCYRPCTLKLTLSPLCLYGLPLIVVIVIFSSAPDAKAAVVVTVMSFDYYYSHNVKSEGTKRTIFFGSGASKIVYYLYFQDRGAALVEKI
jgi:hypothetical protein